MIGASIQIYRLADPWFPGDIFRVLPAEQLSDFFSSFLLLRQASGYLASVFIVKLDCAEFAYGITGNPKCQSSEVFPAIIRKAIFFLTQNRLLINLASAN